MFRIIDLEKSDKQFKTKRGLKKSILPFITSGRMLLVLILQTNKNPECVFIILYWTS